MTSTIQVCSSHRLSMATGKEADMGRRRKVDPKDWDIDGCRALLEWILRGMAAEYIMWLQAKARGIGSKEYLRKCDIEIKEYEHFYLTSPLLDIVEVDRVGVIDTLRRRAGYPISYTAEQKRRDKNDDA